MSDPPSSRDKCDDHTASTHESDDVTPAVPQLDDFTRMLQQQTAASNAQFDQLMRQMQGRPSPVDIVGQVQQQVDASNAQLYAMLGQAGAVAPPPQLDDLNRTFQQQLAEARAAAVPQMNDVHRTLQQQLAEARAPVPVAAPAAAPPSGTAIHIHVALPPTTDASGQPLDPWQQVVHWAHTAWTTLCSVRHVCKCRIFPTCCQMSRLWKLITTAFTVLSVASVVWGTYGGLFDSFRSSSSTSSSNSSSSTISPVRSNVVATKSATEIEAIVQYINRVTLTDMTLQYVPSTDSTTAISKEELALQWTIDKHSYYATTTDLDRYYLVQCYALYTLFASQYVTTPPVEWTDTANWVTAPGNECAWYGIACTSYKLGEGTLAEVLVVTTIQLSDNNLSGELSPDIGLLNYTAVWDVSDNPLLVGPVPTSILEWEFVTTYSVEGTSLSTNEQPILCDTC